MKVPVWVEFSEEREVSVTWQDIRCLLASFEDEMDNPRKLLELAQAVHDCLRAVPDSMIEELPCNQRKIIQTMLWDQASRFEEGGE